MVSSYFATKKRMTQVWDSKGNRWPVTVLLAKPAVVTQVRSEKKDGYNKIQLGIGKKNRSSFTLPQKGHLKKSKLQTPPEYLREVSIRGEDKLESGREIEVNKVFKVGDLVNVRGVSKGRGFSGVIKRWGFSGGPRTHGQSDRERAPGSIGQGTDPGRVHKGKKMPGRYGNRKTTVRNLTVLKVESESSELWVSGAVPGSANSLVEISIVGENERFAGFGESETQEKLVSKDKRSNDEKVEKKQEKEAGEKLDERQEK